MAETYITLDAGPLIKLRNFDLSYVRWCAMHTLNLGVLQYLVGSALRTLAADNHWLGATEASKLQTGFQEFCQWAKENKVP